MKRNDANTSDANINNAKIMIFDSNDMGQNVYLYYDEKSGEGVLIDAGCSLADCDAFAKFTAENNIKIKAILLTHGHYDHITAADKLKNLTNAPICACEMETQMLENPSLNLSIHMGMNLQVSAERLFNEGDVFSFGGISLKVLHTPGHTPGGVCYYDEENGNLFSGDTLFCESIGRTDFPLGNHRDLIKNIKEKLLSLPTDTKVYPGHGASTTISHEKQHNPFLA